MEYSALKEKSNTLRISPKFIDTKLDEYILKFGNLQGCRESIKEAILIIIECFGANGKLLICGNGGSAADADHITGELMKGFLKPRSIMKEFKSKMNKVVGHDISFLKELQGGLPAINLCSNSALITAIANDINSDVIFAQQLLGLAEKKDVLLVISTSGCSKNIINAVLTAKLLDIKCIGLTGGNGGKLNELCEILVKVPFLETARIQENHVVVYHIICELVEEYFY